MIKYFYKSLRSEKLQELDEYKRGAWVYAEAPSHTEIATLVKDFKLTEGHLEDALDEDEMPRLEKEGDQSYIFVRFAYETSEGDIETVPLLFIFGKDFLITVSLVRLPPLDAFLAGKLEFATTQRAKLVLQILGQIVDQYDVYISRTSKQIKLIRSRLRGHDIRNQDFVDFVTIEDELNEFLTSLMPANATLRRLLLGRYMPLFAEDQDIVEDLLLNNEQSIEACNSNIKSVTNIREAYGSISTNNVNRTIKLLTIITVMIMLPSMIFGLYGMNISLPFADEGWILIGIVAATIILNVVVIVLARARRIL